MTKYHNALRWVRVVLLLLYWAILFVGTHVPGRLVPSELGNDKFMHFVAFAGLSFLLSWVIAPLRPTLRAMALTLLIVMGYGALDEWTQSFVSHRTSDIRDWIADVLGALVGLCSYTVSWIFASGLLSSCLRSPQVPATRDVQ